MEPAQPPDAPRNDDGSIAQKSQPVKPSDAVQFDAAHKQKAFASDAGSDVIDKTATAAIADAVIAATATAGNSALYTIWIYLVI